MMVIPSAFNLLTFPKILFGKPDRHLSWVRREIKRKVYESARNTMQVFVSSRRTIFRPPVFKSFDLNINILYQVIVFFDAGTEYRGEKVQIFFDG